MMDPNRRIFTFFKGRVALHAILEAAGIGKGDQVILPGYTCVVVPNAILYRGAEPLYVDIDPATYNLQISALEECLEDNASSGKVKAIIVQHTYGLPADMEAVLEMAARYNLIVIEDACHALGSTIGGQQVGGFGQAAFFSSQWSKPLTTGLGGWAQVNDVGLAERVAEVADKYPKAPGLESFYLHLQYLAFRLLYTPRLFWTIQGVYRKLGHWGLTSGSSSKAELDCLQPGDYHKRMGSWQARTLEGLLRSQTEMAEMRRQRAHQVEQALISRGLPLAMVPEGFDPVWLRYPIRVMNKPELLVLAKAQRVELGDWFLSPVHPNADGWSRAGYAVGSCPVAEEAARQVVNIPTNINMNENEILRTVEFLSRHAKLNSFQSARGEAG
jgi:perosamine synthetase